MQCKETIGHLYCVCELSPNLKNSVLQLELNSLILYMYYYGLDLAGKYNIT